MFTSSEFHWQLELVHGATAAYCQAAMGLSGMTTKAEEGSGSGDSALDGQAALFLGGPGN